MASNNKNMRSDAKHNKLIILETIIELSQQGVNISEMNMADIARKAGVGVGTLYRHFDNKAVLCTTMMDEQVEAMFNNIEQFLDAHQSDTLYNKLYGILSIYVSLKDKNLETLSFIEKSGKKSNSMINIPFFERLKLVLVQQFEGTDYVDVDFKLNVLLNSFSSDFYQYMTKRQGYNKDQFLQHLITTIL